MDLASAEFDVRAARGVGDAATVADALVGIRATRPDVVLLDVYMPDGDGAAVLAALADELPGTRFLALSVSRRRRGRHRCDQGRRPALPDHDRVGRRAHRRGASGRRGDVVFSPRLAGFVLDAFRDAPVMPSIDPQLHQLTPHEKEVLRLLARGYAYKEIAAQLFISVKTAETHASNVLRKLQLSSRHQLPRCAVERRIG